MIGNSDERLFGGINKIIAEKYAKMKEGNSVSDTDQDIPTDKEQLDEVGCRKKMEESQDYKVFMKKDDWDSKIGNLHLNPSQNGKDHVEAKDEHGNVQGWWNGHTGIGYLHKDCCDHALHETNQLGNVEEGTQVSEEMQNEKPQEDTLNNFVSSNTPMAEDASIPDVQIPDGKLDINHSTISETHMTPELQKKQDHYVMKLKKNEDSFKDKYGEDWESVMYATATKLAKNDLGIHESQNDPLQKDSIGDAIVTDQPIKN